jgi:predicted enzyme related to lactoylglutathione lyase
MATAQETTVALGMDAVYYMTKDLQRARNFYENVLGLRATFDMSGDGGGSFVEYELPDGSTFGLGHIPDAPFHESGGAMFAVADVKAALEKAKAAGAQVFFDYMDLQPCEMAWVSDTEGNSLGLHHRKDGSVG